MNYIPAQRLINRYFPRLAYIRSLIRHTRAPKKKYTTNCKLNHAQKLALVFIIVPPRTFAFGIKIKFLKVQNKLETHRASNTHTHNTRSHKQLVCTFRQSYISNKKKEMNPKISTVIAIALASNGHCSSLVFR